MHNQKLLIEPHLLGNTTYFGLLKKFQHVEMDVKSHYIKQTFRNRYQILSTHGIQTLTIPVQAANHTPLDQVVIDYNQKWLQVHLRSLQSSYGKTPFFEHFYPLVADILESQPPLLITLQMNLMSLCLKIMGLTVDLSLSEKYYAELNEHFFDGRSLIHPKKEGFTELGINHPDYPQHFGNTFVKNLSILDVLFLEGPLAVNYLAEIHFPNKNKSE